MSLSAYSLVNNTNAMVFGSNKFRIRRSQSKASYLAYRRERGAPDSEGSYKRTMSPTSRLEDWPPPRDHDDPILLRVTPHQHALQHPLQHRHLHHHNNHQQQQQQQQQQQHELAKSHSVDALHRRLDEKASQQQAQHAIDSIDKLSHELNKKLQVGESRTRTGENNNNDNLEDHHQHLYYHHRDKKYQEKRCEHKEQRESLSPQCTVEVLNDRNRQFERERRRMVTSCELPLTQSREKQPRNADTSLPTSSEDRFRERSATIEMTSQNIALLNRRNEKRSNITSTSTNTISSYAMSTTHICTREVQETLNSQLNVQRVESKNLSLASASPSRSPDRAAVSSSSSPPCKSIYCREDSAASTRTKSSSPTQTDNDTLWKRSISPHAERSSEVKEFEVGSDEFLSSSSISSTSKSSASSSSRNSPIDEDDEEGEESEASISTSGAASGVASDNASTTVSPCVSPQPGIEGLTFVQRTEVVLRVNAATSDAASQTDLMEQTEKQNVVNVSDEELSGSRKKLPEEIECEELSRDLASQLSPNDKLVPILVPVPEHKKPTDYVSGLFRVEATLQPRTKHRLSLLDESMASCAESVDDEDKNHDETIPSVPVTPSSTDCGSPLSPTSAYFTTSEGKARFLTRYSRDVAAEDPTKEEETSVVVTNDTIDLRQKKEELMMRLDKKLVVLRAEQEAVREEGEVNEALGARVATRISALARPTEASKYRLHVEEVGKITSLLLGLSGRLARAENALYGMPADHAERKTLESKRDKLMDQLEEAKVLKSNIDKRSVNVSAILAKYLNDEEFADYQHFINMKAKLIVDGREIQDKVKLGEEQLAALKEAIN